MTIFSIAFLQALQINPYMAIFRVLYMSLIWPTTFVILVYTMYMAKKVENEIQKNRDTLE